MNWGMNDLPEELRAQIERSRREPMTAGAGRRGVGRQRHLLARRRRRDRGVRAVTPAQARVLDAFRAHVEQFGYEPSFSQLMAATGLKSKSPVKGHIDALVTQGVLVRTPGGKSAYRLAGAPDLRSVPLDAIKAELARRGIIIGALDRVQTRTMSSKVAHCAADGCDVDVQRGHLMCWAHWSVLPRALQHGLFEAHGKRDTATFAGLLAQARDIAATVKS